MLLYLDNCVIDLDKINYIQVCKPAMTYKYTLYFNFDNHHCTCYNFDNEDIAHKALSVLMEKIEQAYNEGLKVLTIKTLI